MMEKLFWIIIGSLFVVMICYGLVEAEKEAHHPIDIRWRERRMEKRLEKIVKLLVEEHLGEYVSGTKIHTPEIDPGHYRVIVVPGTKYMVKSESGDWIVVDKETFEERQAEIGRRHEIRLKALADFLKEEKGSD